jgi:hypothetical protein
MSSNLATVTPFLINGLRSTGLHFGFLQLDPTNCEANDITTVVVVDDREEEEPLLREQELWRY